MTHQPKRFLLRALGLALLLCSSPATLAAGQDNPDEPAQPAGPPVHEGRNSVTAPIGQAGATMRLSNGAELVLPPGLPIGNSRLLTFSTGRTVGTNQVRHGFLRVGPTLKFDGAINAQRAPLIVSIRARRLSSRPGHRLVLAMEQPGLCTDENQSQPLGAGLCSTWTIVDATYDAGVGRVRAELPVTGGLRLQFGWLPEEEEPEGS